MATSPMSLQQFGQTVKAKHPEYADMADEDLAQRVLSKYPQYQDMVAPGVPKAPIPAGLQGPPSAAAQPPSLLQRAGSAIADFGVGAAKGLAHTSSTVNKSFFGDPADNNSLYMKSSDSISPALANEVLTPSNTAQSIGRGVEQVGEFLVPIGAERAGAAKLASLAPGLGKYAAPAARVATSALSSGLVNKAQGGSFGAGAATGVAGGAVGEGMRTLAPRLAESALGIRNTDRAFSADPGRAILDETKGFRPLTVSRSAKDAVNNLVLEQRNLAANSPATVSLQPSRDAVTEAMQRQAYENAIPQIERINPLQQQISVTGNPRGGFPTGVNPLRPPGTPIPTDVPALEGLDLRRGIGNFQAEKPWTGKASSDPLTNAIKSAYQPLSQGLHTAVPGLQQVDTRLHNLLPVADRAAAKDLNAPLMQRVMGRFGAHTGALTAAGMGAAGGGAAHGLPGALAGGALGLFGTELAASPTFQMIGARAFNRPSLYMPAAQGAGLVGSRYLLTK